MCDRKSIKGPRHCCIQLIVEKLKEWNKLKKEGNQPDGEFQEYCICDECHKAVEVGEKEHEKKGKVKKIEPKIQISC